MCVCVCVPDRGKFIFIRSLSSGCRIIKAKRSDQKVKSLPGEETSIECTTIQRLKHLRSRHMVVLPIA